MNTLIILAHGSRREESNLEIKELARKVNALKKSNYNLVDYAYLEIASPSLPEAIDNNIIKGALNITIFPYFLNSGNHVMRDIPGMIEKAKKKYPDCLFKTSACIGMIEDMPELILQQALKT